jgi:hypothetical protein
MPTPNHMVPMTDADLQSLRRLDSIFRANGYDPEIKGRASIKDAMDIQNAAFLIPRVLTQIVQEGIEPLLIGTSLLTRIDYVEGMQTVFPAVPPLHAAEVGDGMGLPLYDIAVAGAMTYGTKVSRHGLGLKIAKRFVENSQYPWINYWLRLAGNALARHKEEYIFSFITQLGTVVFNNSTASRTIGATTDVPIKGATTGRNLKGQFNGSMTVDDVYDMYAAVLLNGFIPDTMLVHPMAWLMWVKDPVLREFAIQAGGGAFFANFTGNLAAQQNNWYNFGGLGQGHGATSTYTGGVVDPTSPEGNIATMPQNRTSAPVLPNYLGLPFRILVSPFMNFNPATRETDILMFNSKNLGALIVENDAHVRNFDDARYGITEMYIEENYGFGIINEGQAIAVAKNVRVVANEIVLPARSTLDIAQSATFEETIPAGFGASPTDINSR